MAALYSARYLSIQGASGSFATPADPTDTWLVKWISMAMNPADIRAGLQVADSVTNAVVWAHVLEATSGSYFGQEVRIYIGAGEHLILDVDSIGSPVDVLMTGYRFPS